MVIRSSGGVPAGTGLSNGATTGITGRSRKFDVGWCDVSLMDRYETAHAEFYEQQGEQLKQANVKAEQVDHFIFPTSFAKMDAQLAKACGVRPEAVVDALLEGIGDSGLGHPIRDSRVIPR